MLTSTVDVDSDGDDDMLPLAQLVAKSIAERRLSFTDEVHNDGVPSSLPDVS